MLFFGLSGVVDGNRVYSIEENEQKAPYFELFIQKGEYITYSINISKNKVFVQNIPILNNKDYSLLFRLLKIDFEGVQEKMKEQKLKDMKELIAHLVLGNDNGKALVYQTVDFIFSNDFFTDIKEEAIQELRDWGAKIRDDGMIYLFELNKEKFRDTFLEKGILVQVKNNSNNNQEVL